MRQAHGSWRRRAAFTLVELLIVILIMAILFALATGAVIKALGKADEVRARNDITQLANGVAAFKQHFNVSYIPDSIVLPPGYDSMTAQYITSLFPRINSATLGTGTTAISINNQNYPNGVFDYWGVTGTNGQPVTLFGDQAIVFFLGGKYIPNSGCLGFSTNPTDPMGTAQATLTGTRIGPFIEFPTNRLVLLSASTTHVGLGNPPSFSSVPKRASSFPSYADVFGLGMPYFYFSSRRAGNDYSGTHQAPSALNLSSGVQANPSTSWIAFTPYWNSTLPNTNPPVPRYVNPNGFQIICAGRDGCFGGGVDSSNNVGGGKFWAGFNSGTGSSDLGGYDNYSNFHPTVMGIPAP
jgi:prepilin-type N-terminal cleavage/methylation domain-containing protein